MQTRRLTLFTPTYNRAYILPKLYESLCVQDLDDFEWLIVDDGSTDDTPQLVARWQQENRIPITFFRQANGGKMRAHNEGVRRCKTELFVCIDSDDVMASPTAVRDMLAFWDSHQTEVSRPDVCGMISYRKTSGLKGYFPEALQLLKLKELYQRGSQGEAVLLFRTEVIRQYPFPEIEGEKFITEDIVWQLLDQQYLYLLFPYYSQCCEYLPDGYTRHGLEVLLKNPKGYAMYYNQSVRLGEPNRRYHMRMYIACSLLASDRKMIAHSCSKGLLFLMLPMGFLQYRRFLKKKW